MKTRTILTLLVACFALVFSSIALAEKPTWSGGDRGGGGNQDKGDLYGDLMIIDRNIDGVPLLTDGHVQPIVRSDPALIPDDCDTSGFEPVSNESMYYIDNAPTALRIPLDAEGEVPLEFSPCTMEPHIGRLSVARAPYEVRQLALEEAERILGLADGVDGFIDLDAAGRLRVHYTDDELNEVVRTIDASLENLAMFEAFMEDGELPTMNVLEFYGESHLHAAAAMLGTAADKTGDVSIVDVTQYVNAFMAIPDEVDPLVNDPHTLKDQNFYDFSAFKYTRSVSFPNDREICYLKVVSDVADAAGYFLVDVVTEGVMEVDGLFDEDFEGTNISAFAQAADDTRRVIEFMHTHTVPDELLDECEE